MYGPYRLNQAADAFYTGGPNRDYIVMKSIAPEDYPIALHEYFHLVVQHSPLHLPLWLNEGMAEIYSTAKPAGRQIRIGDILPGRLHEMQTSPWLRLDALLAVTRGSPLYTEKDPAGMFYAESWALSHMLYLSNEYWQKFAEFLTLIRPDATQATTLQRVYGKSLAEISSDLQEYLQGTRFNGARLQSDVGEIGGRAECASGDGGRIGIGAQRARWQSPARRMKPRRLMKPWLGGRNPKDACRSNWRGRASPGWRPTARR